MINDMLISLKNSLFGNNGLFMAKNEKTVDIQISNTATIINKLPVDDMTMEEYLRYSLLVVEFSSTAANLIGTEKKYRDLFYSMYEKMLESSYYNEFM